MMKTSAAQIWLSSFGEATNTQGRGPSDGEHGGKGNDDDGDEDQDTNQQIHFSFCCVLRV